MYIMLANPFEPPHKVAEIGPQPLGRVHMHLIDSVAVVVPCPFPGAVANGGVAHRSGAHPVVGVALVTVAGALFAPVQAEGFPHFLLRHVAQHFEAYQPALPPNRAIDGRTVVFPRAEPLFLLARRRGGSSGSGWGIPFSPEFWNTSSLSVTVSGNREDSRLKWAFPISSCRR